MKVLKFGAIWCPGCLVMRPLWKKIEEEFPWLVTEMIDFDKNKESVARFNISNKLPVYVFVDKTGEEITRLQGERSKKELVELIETYREL